MSNFIYIISQIIFPIFLIIAIGYNLQKKFSLHIPTLSKIQIYVLVPSLIFNTLYFSTLEGNVIGQVIAFNTIFFCLLILLSTGVSKIMKQTKPKEKAFINAVSLRNIGNYGIPLVTLLYIGQIADRAISIHMISVITCTVLMYTIGLYNASSGHYGWKDALKNIMGIPIVYVISLAVILRLLPFAVPAGIMTSTGFLGRCVAPLALFTLGAQLAETTFHPNDISIYIGNALRLIVSPMMAYLLAIVMQLEPFTTSLMVLGAATPTAVNSLFLAIEFKGDAEYASQTIFLSTLLSAFTVTFVIFIITPLIQ